MANTKIVLFESTSNPGGICIMHPCEEYLTQTGSTVLALAKRDIPKGKKFKIIEKDSESIFADRVFRNAWAVDFSSYDGVGEQE